MNRQHLTTAVLFVITAAMVYLCYEMATPFLVSIFGAVILVILFQPVHLELTRRIKSPNLSAGIATLLVVCFIMLPLLFVGILVGRELGHFYHAARVEARLHSNVDDGSGFTWLVDSLSQQIGRVIHIDKDRVDDFILDHFQQINEFMLGRTTNIIKNLASLIFHMVLAILAMFFLFRDRKKVVAKLEDLVPLSKEDAHEVFSQAHDLIIGTVSGMGLIALMQGILSGLAFWLVGIPSALLWTILMCFFAFIPVIGSTVIWAPTVVILIAQGHITKGIILLVWIGVILNLLDHTLRPVLIGRHTQLHTIVILFSVLGGITVFGPLGVVMGPVVTAITLSLLDIIRREFGPIGA